MNGEDYAKIAFEQGYDSSMMLEAISNKGALAPVASAATETQTYSEDMVQNLLQTIEERGRLSLPEISETAKLLGYPAVTASDLSTSLDGYMLFRREETERPIPSDPGLEIERLEYMKWLCQVDQKSLLFIDDFSTNLLSLSIRSIQKSDIVPIIDLETQENKGVMACVCMSYSDGLIYYTTSAKTSRREVFSTFLKDLLPQIQDCGYWLVVDNKDGLMTSTDVDIVEQYGNEVVFLPPCSSALNPLLPLFKQWQFKLKQFSLNDYNDLIMLSRTLKWNLRLQKRQRLIVEMMNQTIDCLTKDEFQVAEDDIVSRAQHTVSLPN